MRLQWLALVLMVLGGPLRAEWEIVGVDGQEYVTLASLAADLGLGAPTPSATEFSLTGTGGSLVVKTDSRQALINGVRHWLSYPTRARGAAGLVSRVDVERTITPALQPLTVKGLRPVATVVLDAGHGGHDRGARSSFGVEKDFALDVTNRVRKRLEKAGMKVVQTRLGDTFIPLESRPAMTRKYSNSIFVSIHFNSADWNTAANGLEVFAISPLGAPPSGQAIPQARDRNREAGHALEPANFVLANTILHSLMGKTTSFDRGVKRARFVVLKEATAPAALIEGGFLTNPAEAARIAAPAWREAYADAIATGILEYKKLAEQGVAPKRVTDYGKAGTTGFVPE
jgi:N-acetylmuramoyl-L-alanine amidase